MWWVIIMKHCINMIHGGSKIKQWCFWSASMNIEMELWRSLLVLSSNRREESTLFRLSSSLTYQWSGGKRHPNPLQTKPNLSFSQHIYSVPNFLLWWINLMVHFRKKWKEGTNVRRKGTLPESVRNDPNYRVWIEVCSFFSFVACDVWCVVRLRRYCYCSSWLSPSSSSSSPYWPSFVTSTGCSTKTPANWCWCAYLYYAAFVNVVPFW